ncbi:MAG: 50S ribosomal protein L34e [Promethearchaeota archaeon]
MVRPAHRSHSMARKKRHLPGGGFTIHYVRRKPHGAHCQSCGAKLLGVPRVRPARLNKFPKNQRRPERPYGGNLCPRCLKTKLKQATWNLNSTE